VAYIALALAIAADIGATLALQHSNGLSRWIPAALSVLCYVVVFVSVSMALTTIPVSLVYAIWSGVGTATIALIGVTILDEPVSPAKVAGIGLIVAGVVLLNLTGAGKAAEG
jgi:small multidrug resistance pump